MALAPEDINQVKTIIKDDIAKPTEGWSWLKFLGGVFNGRNYAKAIIFTICQAVILGILLCVFLVVRGYMRPRPVPTDTSTLSGQTVTQNIDKSERQVSQTYLPFAGGLLSFGSHGKTQSQED